MRLTKKVIYKDNYINEHFPSYDANLQDNSDIKTRLMQITDKFGKLEDILEGHNIETLEELDGLLWYAKRIKDIEKELAIDLITLFKAVNDGFYYTKPHLIKSDNGNYSIHYVGTKARGIRLCGFGWCLTFFDETGKQDIIPIRTYKKNWALTREELE